jgi:hypothetical protein
VYIKQALLCGKVSKQQSIQGETDMVTGYCVKCKEKGVELSAPEIVQTAKGGYMAKGKHEKCGTTVCAMMSKDNAEKAVEGGATKAY